MLHCKELLSYRVEECIIILLENVGGGKSESIGIPKRCAFIPSPRQAPLSLKMGRNVNRHIYGIVTHGA